MSRVVIAGGGLAGLSVAGLLASKGHQVVLFEKMFELGGRAIAQERDGFRLNYGAHAVYARDLSAMEKTLNKIGVSVDFISPDMNKVRYITEGGEETEAPINLSGLLHTKLLPKASDKIDFVRSIVSILTSRLDKENRLSLQDWLETKNWTGATKRLLLHFAATNFFLAQPGELPLSTFLRYYRRVFRSKHPVSYIVGGWGSMTYHMRLRLQELGVQIHEKAAITSLQFEHDRIKSVQTRNEVYEADIFVLCVPPSALKKLITDTPLASCVLPYMSEQQNCAFVYDVALKNRIRDDISYINDVKNHVFITDPSLYDQDCVPPNGQLLQAIAYTKPGSADDDETLLERKNTIESVLDRYYSGWRETLAFSRVVDQAVIQGIGWGNDQKRLPIHFPEFANVFFAGDWCDAEGSASDVAFHSALKVASSLDVV